jgi:GxxExxY protein
MKHQMILDSKTEILIGTAFEVMNEMGQGFLESVYHNAFAIALNQKGFHVQSEVHQSVLFRGFNVGNFKVDLLLDKEIIVEVKAVERIIGDHKAQVINYLVASGLNIGLIINFGKPKVEIARLANPKNLEKYFIKSAPTNQLNDI